MQTLLLFPLMSFFLAWDPIQHDGLHLVLMSFFVFHDLETFGEYWPVLL